MKIFIGKHLIWQSKKELRKYADFRRVVEVAASCTTDKHTESAMRYIHNYLSYYKIDSENKDHKYLFTLCSCIIVYLQDTKMHCREGYHVSMDPKSFLEKKTNYPDINDYIYHLLGFRVRSF